MGMVLKFLVIGAVLVALHEIGHYLMAKAVGYDVKFVVTKTGLAVAFGPKGNEPFSDWQPRHIAVAGFGLEIAAVIGLMLWSFEYALMGQIFLLLHYCFYPFRMIDSDANDFNYKGKR